MAQKLLGILSAKCPLFTGLLRTDYVKLFLYDPYGSWHTDRAYPTDISPKFY